ncbi:MAG: hypothetical protein LBB92_02755 [Endomicrobium sp.]|jgi:hypothetical protein|nr:hypothetical protein [Endomicrobium sp.]
MAASITVDFKASPLMPRTVAIPKAISGTKHNFVRIAGIEIIKYFNFGTL